MSILENIPYSHSAISSGADLKVCFPITIPKCIMSRATKYFKVIIHIALLVFTSYFIKQKSVKRVIVNKIARYLPDMKYILLWTNISRLEIDGQSHFVDRNCEYINCYITRNRSFFEDVRYFDAIMFNLQGVSEDQLELPKARGLTQKYIFAANDSADNYPVCNSVYEDFFNWTWSYRLDSTIQYRFFSFKNVFDEHLGNNLQWKQNMKPIDKSLKSILSSKYKAAAIFLDKCQTRSRRENFLKNLQTHLSTYNLTVDVFGVCGPLKCGKRSMNSCFYRLKKNYYFYLAFEDSISTDFVTSSVMYGYQHNAVPIVYGGALYRRYLPHHSYLNGRELGEKHLAEKMHEIIQNKNSYYDYFRWRNHYIIKESTVLDPCILCQTFNNPAWLLHRVSYVKFREWWNPEYEQRCGFSRRFLSL